MAVVDGWGEVGIVKGIREVQQKFKGGKEQHNITDS